MRHRLWLARGAAPRAVTIEQSPLEGDRVYLPLLFARAVDRKKFATSRHFFRFWNLEQCQRKNKNSPNLPKGRSVVSSTLLYY